VAARVPECSLEVHQGRFINLQRLVMRPSPLGKRMAAAAAAGDPSGEGGPAAFVKVGETAASVELAPLHPCAAVTLELLQTESFDALSISFTPRDAYALYASLATHAKDMVCVGGGAQRGLRLVRLMLSSVVCGGGASNERFVFVS
jgi:hypothetical protein